MRTCHAAIGGMLLAALLFGGGPSLQAEENEEGLYLCFDTGRSFVVMTGETSSGLEGGGEATLVNTAA